MNLQQILSDLRVDYQEAGHRHVRPGWIGLDCPSCSPNSHRYLLGINLEQGYANCWQCGPKRIVEVLVELTGRRVGEVLDLLKGVGWEKVRKERPAGSLKLPFFITSMEEPHRRYLERRGLDPDLVARLWGVKAMSINGRYPWRLFIPIVQNDLLVSWTTRAIGDRIAKRYDNAPADCERVPAKHVLYGDDYARHSVVVVEGPVDCWAIGPGAVSVMGLAYTRQQLMLIAAHPVRAICFDAEPAAQRRAWKLAEELKVFPGETGIIELESGKDAAEADRDEIEEIRSRFLN